MSQVKSKKIIIFLGILALIIPPANGFYAYYTQQPINIVVSLVPNFIILLAAYLIRFLLLDIASIEVYIPGTCMDTQICCIRRYIDFLFLAMNAGIVATITIYLNFFAGALIYLIKHILLITAFSGIINLNFVYIRHVQKKLFYFLYVIFWIVLVHLLFFLFAMREIRSLVLLPYGYALGSMTAISILGLFYTKRSLGFRLMVATGALIFLFSDLCIVLAGPERNAPFVYLINPTYVLAIFLLCYSQLFLKRVPKEIQVNGS